MTVSLHLKKKIVAAETLIKPRILPLAKQKKQM